MEEGDNVCDTAQTIEGKGELGRKEASIERTKRSFFEIFQLLWVAFNAIEDHYCVARASLLPNASQAHPRTLPCKIPKYLPFWGERNTC